LFGVFECDEDAGSDLGFDDGEAVLDEGSDFGSDAVIGDESAEALDGVIASVAIILVLILVGLIARHIDRVDRYKVDSWDKDKWAHDFRGRGFRFWGKS